MHLPSPRAKKIYGRQLNGANPTIGTPTGSVTLALYTVPPDVTGTVTINGPVTNISIGTPGQNGDLTFNGTAGQLATVSLSYNTMCVTVSLLQTGGGASLASLDGP